MGRTLAQTRGDVETYLGDTANAIWSDAELNSYIKEGYDDLCLRTGILWKKDAPSGIQPVSGTGTYTLPTDLLKIERLTWKKRRLTPLYPEEAAKLTPTYRTAQGPIDGYIVEGDGLRVLRYYRVPAATDSDISIEYQRRGADLAADGTELELPDRYVDYVTWFAMGRAWERDGIGQDLALSQLFKDRYSAGIVRIKRRLSAVQSARIGSLGGYKRPVGPPLPKFPWNYGA